MSKNDKTFESIADLSSHLIAEVFGDQQKDVVAVYAFNATGKTRLARTFEDSQQNTDIDPEYVESIVYGADFEDMFHWNNETRTLNFGVESSWILRLIRDEGLENRIADKFKTFFYTHAEPIFNFEDGTVNFTLATGDENHVEHIKISKGEESLLIWSIFLTLLDAVYDTLDQDPDNRSTDVFNNLKYIVVDDPVSSIDDAKIVSVGSDLTGMAKKLKTKEVKVLITTHHALFYSVVVNTLRGNKYFRSYHLSRNLDGDLSLGMQGDSTFAYHLHAKSLIRKAIDDNEVERYHFNIFRALLEKTANFLGYSDWTQCLDSDYRNYIVRLLHTYSHSRLSDIEPRALASEDVQVFGEAFKRFVAVYKWSP
ncbi:AAA family ATPase [Rhodococcus pyridinivorans]|uniref:AAA family ATPase n=1 Tax=Rhodococcus pyridinivorans TaxID=103816 RepID=UPI001902D827|nr:AAA family ATPase [Rhodococcus pyridinivorans]QQM51884.1 AAA family ATPase [Rhodococcus pyridinivorans]